MALSATGGVIGYWKAKENALVPTSRKVNNKALNSDVTIERSDIIESAETDYDENIQTYVMENITEAIGDAIGGEY